MIKQDFRVTGMTCAACQASVSRRVSKLDGVTAVNVNLLSGKMTVEYDESLTDSGNICAAVGEIGYGASVFDSVPKGKSSLESNRQAKTAESANEIKAMKRRLIFSFILLLPLMYISMGHMLRLPLPTIFGNALISAFTQLLLTIPVIVANGKFFTVGFRSLAARAPNMDSLVALGSSAAFIYGIFALYRMIFGLSAGDAQLVEHYSHQLYFESCAMILTLVTVGKYLEARSKAKTSDALGRLLDLAPKTARILVDGKEQVIPASELKFGDSVIIRPGESIPADGEIISGRGFLDQSAVTGESVPVEKSVGDAVICATVNKNGSFTLRATRVGDDTTLAQIVRLVDNAGNSKAPIARLADKISGVFVPVVIAVAAVTAVIWLLAGKGGEFALSCAISVLVISCPCALGLATPVAIMVGTGKAAEFGILIKSAQSLEALGKADTVVLDKTGTLTNGTPLVTDIYIEDSELTADRFLALAASAEAGSEHPLAKAVVERAQGLEIPEADSFEAIPGRGLRAAVQGIEITAGNAAFIGDAVKGSSILSKADEFASQGKTPLIFAFGGKAAGIIAVADTLRDTSKKAVADFHSLGFQTVMLTGDNDITAKAVGGLLGIGKVISGVMPAQKEQSIRSLQAEGHSVVMIGDGINDAPALMRADIGIAIGAGTDIAIDCADIVLMKNSLDDAVTAIRLSRAVMRNIKMNLFWAFFYNVLGIPIAAGALYPLFALRLSPMIGSAAMSLSSVCVVSNALRLRRFGAGTTHPSNDINGTEGSIELKKTIKIEGMMCAHCKAHVEAALAAVEGVASVLVDLETGTAEVTLSAEVDNGALSKAITQAGYKPIEITQ